MSSGTYKLMLPRRLQGNSLSVALISKEVSDLIANAPRFNIRLSGRDASAFAELKKSLKGQLTIVADLPVTRAAPPKAAAIVEATALGSVVPLLVQRMAGVTPEQSSAIGVYNQAVAQLKDARRQGDADVIEQQTRSLRNSYDSLQAAFAPKEQPIHGEASSANTGAVPRTNGSVVQPKAAQPSGTEKRFTSNPEADQTDDDARGSIEEDGSTGGVRSLAATAKQAGRKMRVINSGKHQKEFVLEMPDDTQLHAYRLFAYLRHDASCPTKNLEALLWLANRTPEERRMLSALMPKEFSALVEEMLVRGLPEDLVYPATNPPMEANLS